MRNDVGTEGRIQISGIIGKTDITAGQQARRGQQELPIEEKGQRLAQALGPEDVAQVNVRAARAWISGGKLGPDHRLE